MRSLTARDRVPRPSSCRARAERGRLVRRVDEHAHHADGVRPCRARRRVVEEHDVGRSDPQRLGDQQVALRVGLGHAGLRGVDERSDSGELGTSGEPLAAEDHVGVVRQDAHREPGRAGVVHQRHCRRIEQRVGNHLAEEAEHAEDAVESGQP